MSTSFLCRRGRGCETIVLSQAVEAIAHECYSVLVEDYCLRRGAPLDSLTAHSRLWNRALAIAETRHAALWDEAVTMHGERMSVAQRRAAMKVVSDPAGLFDNLQSSCNEAPSMEAEGAINREESNVK
jgi:hypothetical protein